MRKFERDLAREFANSVIKPTRGNHFAIQLPNGETVHTGSTPSDHRSIKNLRATARRLMKEVDPNAGATMPFARFERCSGRPDGRLKDGIKAVCPQCHRTETIYLDRPQILDSDEPLIAGKFEKRGWGIGTTSSQHRCPKCSKPQHPKKERAVSNKVVPIVPPAPTMAMLGKGVSTKEPSREDKKIIHRKIMEVYSETHYAGDWSDQKVADDLGVAVAWVAAIRGEFFGEDVNEQAGKLTEARALLTEIEAATADARSIIEPLQELLAKAEQVRAALLNMGGERS